MTRNKVYKTTSYDRFADVNPYLVQQLRTDRLSEVKILDIGVSSGVSTIELYDDLHAGGLSPAMVATDILVDAFLVSVLPWCYALVDPNGFPLRFDLPFGTMKPWVVRRDYRTGFAIFRKLVNATFTSRANRILRNPDAKEAIKVKLITPRLLVNDCVNVYADDVRQYNGTLAHQFDFIRAANVLNSGYFSTVALSSILGNVRRYLRGPSAYLLVVRTHDDNHNHGTLFRLDDNSRFCMVRRFGQGSEIENLVLQSGAPAM